MTVDLILTQGPFSRFLEPAAAASGAAGLRLNTIMPVPADRYTERLRALRHVCRGPLWVDLKTRQLRVRAFANTPYTAVTITHRVRCNLPTTVYFDNGRLSARLVGVEGYRLILESYVGRLIGPGESVNIPDSSLTLLDDELFTSNDLEWIAACRVARNHHYMLSFVESAADVARLRQADPEAVIMAKIESRKGVARLDEITAAADFVMAARGDLYVEIAPPHAVDAVVAHVVRTGGPRAVVGSRILESLLREPVPSLSDLSDLHRLRDMGVRVLLIGDDLCFDESLLLRAVRIVREVWHPSPASPESGQPSDARCRSRAATPFAHAQRNRVGKSHEHS